MASLPRVLSLAMVAVLIASCTTTTPTDAPSEAPGAPLDAARLEVSPATVLLTRQGDTRQLTASLVKPEGPTGATATWSSSDAAVVGVSADGLVTANALGSAQVTAESDGLRSAPVLVVVSPLGEGVAPVTDEQILTDPVDTDPNGEPSAEATYDVVVAGITPAIGDRLVGTGGDALAGEVVATAPADGGTKLTMRLVPLAELLPGLELEQVIDLANAPVSVPADVAELYDVTRAGNRFDFAPKANFDELIGRAGRGPTLAAFHGTPVGTSGAIPPFHECEGSLPSLPISVGEAPNFSVEINPTVDVAWSADELQHLIVRATPTLTAKLKLELEAAFEASYECKRELFIFQIPIAGAFSFFIAGLVPVGVGFEIKGKFTLAQLSLGSEIEASANAALGIDCGDGTCDIVNTLDDFDVKFKPDITGPSLADLRLEAELEVFAYAEADVGNRFLRRLRFEAVNAKVGGKFAGNWAPQLVQILDDEYESEVGLSLEASASVGPRLGELAEMLGLDDITFLNLEVKTPLEQSPTGTLTVDLPRYETGETVTAHVTLAEEGLHLFELIYDVKKVLLVRHSGGRAEVVATSEPTQTGQSQFDLSFEAPGVVDAGELYAFVVSYLPPIDSFALELPRAAPVPTGTPKPTAANPEGGWRGTLTIAGAAPIEFRVDLTTQTNPSETKAVGDIAFDPFSVGQLPYRSATGRIQLEIERSGDVRASLRIENGAQMPDCTLFFTGIGTINPVGDVIEVPVDGTTSCGASGAGLLRLERN